MIGMMTSSFKTALFIFISITPGLAERSNLADKNVHNQVVFSTKNYEYYL